MRMVKFLFSYVLLTGISCGGRLWIEPDQSQIVLMEGDTLRLDCIHEYSRSENSMGSFKKDGRIIPVSNENGYSISLLKEVISTGMSSTITLAKNYVTVRHDTGIYSCDINKIVASVSVIVVKVIPEDAEINDEPIDYVELSCSVQNPPIDLLQNVSWTWVHGNTILQANQKYTMFNEDFDGILRINKPDREDIGKYECLLGERYEIATKKSTYTYLKAKANIARQKNAYREHGVEFTCKASGYPRPVIVWTKNKVVLNNSMIIEESEISTTSSLIIEDINSADDGMYACAAYSDLDSENTTAEFEISPQVRAQLSGVTSINEFSCTRISTLMSLTSILFIYNIIVYL